MDHGVHHPRDDHWLAQDVAVGDDRLLHQGHLLRQHIQAEVAAAQDDSIRATGNVLEFEERLSGLTLGKHLQSPARCKNGRTGLLQF